MKKSGSVVRPCEYLLVSLLLLPLAGCSGRSGSQGDKAQDVKQQGAQWQPPTFSPRFPGGNGPHVWIDEGHGNFHRLRGRFAAFGELLRRDGYRVSPRSSRFSAGSLAHIRVLVIANALNPQNAKAWRAPIHAAFSTHEVKALVAFVRGGGRLLLIADHMPFPGAAKELAAAFGFGFNDGFAFKPGPQRGIITFSSSTGTLVGHPMLSLLRGPSVDSFVTFTGQAFTIPKGARPLLRMPAGSYSLMPTEAWKFQPSTPKIDVSGWYQGATLTLGSGRLALFGEAASFTAQTSHKGKRVRHIGMNNRRAADNWRFVRATMAWLTHKL